MNQYFVKLGNDVEGPLSESELRERLSAQRIPSNALIKQGHNGGEFTTDYVKRHTPVEDLLNHVDQVIDVTAGITSFNKFIANLAELEGTKSMKRRLAKSITEQFR